MKNLSLILFLTLFLGKNSSAQETSANEKNALTSTTKTLTFKAEINGQALQLNKNYFFNSIKDSISIYQLKFYISSISLSRGNEIKTKPSDQYFLIDFDDALSLERTISIDTFNDFNRICFTIGVDSIKQYQGAHGGDLDPSLGMYWSWQSGYINFKLEGNSNKCPSRDNSFQFHIGGFQAPFNSIQNVNLPLAKEEKIILTLDLNKILSPQYISKDYKIMSPNQKAMDFASKLPSLFRLEP